MNIEQSRTSYRVIGLDPGSRRAGYGIIRSEGRQMFAEDYGCINLPENLPLPKRLISFTDIFEKILHRYPLDAMAVENIFTAKNVQSVLKLGQVRGVAIMMGARLGLEIFEYAPSNVKIAVAGYGRAEKTQVQFMVQKILRLPEKPSPLDVSDALAIAICHLNNIRMANRLRQNL